ncbi:hypothetical protein ACE7GA_05330 [Roseomonas sp. CCTCC AB2023176]|uniref:DUF6894 family protein n=1 Tax=Roseomonas sp. CCTCC AB2023176 TaxID=3342640 RepID=UPI0035D5B9B1
MPRYYFLPGESGTAPSDAELANQEAARSEGLLRLADELRRQAHRRVPQGECTLKVTDDSGVVLFHLISAIRDMPAARPRPR